MTVRTACNIYLLLFYPLASAMAIAADQTGKNQQCAFEKFNQNLQIYSMFKINGHVFLASVRTNHM